MVSQRSMIVGQGKREGMRVCQRTEEELLNGSPDIDAECHLKLVDLELHPFAERFELGAHGCERKWEIRRGGTSDDSGEITRPRSWEKEIDRLFKRSKQSSQRIGSNAQDRNTRLWECDGRGSGFGNANEREIRG